MAESSVTQAPEQGATNSRVPREGFYRGRGPRRRGGHRRGDGRGDGSKRGGGENNVRRRMSSSSEPIDPTKPKLVPKEPGSPQQVRHNEQAVEQEAEDEDVEAEVCFICASPVIHNSVAPCNHRTCHICALRLRALYKTKGCAHCRTHADFVVFTDDPIKRFEDFADAPFAKTDGNLGIKYERNDIFEDTVLLLRYNCPDPSCDIACYGWPDLHKHVRNVHHRVMCDLCTRNKKVFTHEHDLFTHAELRKHEKYGDDNPGAVDQSGFKGHPECGFCRQRFYGDDELYTHCRDKHERCHICDRLHLSRQQQYYLDYNALEVHFRKDHFLCPDQECLDKKFVVFESEMDLKAHQLETHPNGLSKDARRDARRVDMAGFDYRPQHQDQRGGGRGRGRGRDPNVEPLPVSSAQSLRRDELAFQRQMQVHSAQSVSNRTFGGELTPRDAFAARTSASDPPTITAPRESIAAEPPPLDALTLESSPNLSAADRARQLRHTAVIERASNLLKNDQASIASFRSRVSAYRNSNITAAQLIDSFFSLFDTSASELGTLVKELADIFEVPGKKDDLLKAWNDWRAINEDYPSLPGPNGVAAGSNTSSGGKRILKLKSSTAQSSKSPVNARGAWGTASGTTQSNPFPPMPAPAASRPAPSKVPWVTPASSTTASSTARPSPASSGISTSSGIAKPRVSGNSTDAFPALPAAQKPGMNVTRPGYSGNLRLKGNGSGTGTPASVWGGSLPGNTVASTIDEDTAGNDGDGAAAKGKGKAKKKVFMHWG